MRLHRITKFLIATNVVLALGARAEEAKVPAPAAQAPAATASAASAPTTTAAETPAPVNFHSDDVWDTEIFNHDDNKVLVIHDRKFTKAGKLELGLLGGVTSSSAFYNSWSYGATADYHFSEYLGVEASVNNSSSSFSQDGKQIDDFLTARQFGSTKEFQQPKLVTSMAAMWSPIYGKFAFFRSSIVYYDFYGLAGLSYLETDSNVVHQDGKTMQKHVGSLLGLGMRVFLNNHFSLRFDVRNNIYRSEFAAVTNSLNQVAIDQSTVTRAQFQFLTGVSYLFGL